MDAARLAVVELTLHYIGDGDRALILAAASATAAAGGGQDFSQAVRDALYYHNWDSGAEGGSGHQSKKPRSRYLDPDSSWGDEGAQGKGRGKGYGKGNGGKGKGKAPGKGNGYGDQPLRFEPRPRFRAAILGGQQPGRWQGLERPRQLGMGSRGRRWQRRQERKGLARWQPLTGRGGSALRATETR